MSVEDLTLKFLDSFLEDQNKRLESDKGKLMQKNEGLKYRHSVSGYEREVSKKSKVVNTCDNSAKRSTIPDKNKMVNGKTPEYDLLNAREKEKEKLINVLSVPKTRQSFPGAKQSNKRDSPRLQNVNITLDEREKEKDRLAEIFASSGQQYSKLSCCQISKNLHSNNIFDNNQIVGSNKTKNNSSTLIGREKRFPSQVDEFNTCKKQVDPVNSLENNYQDKYIPQILVSEYQEDLKHSKDSHMVRIGEFSPLNPRLMATKSELGVGEHDHARQYLSDQRRLEYNQYLQGLQQVATTQACSQRTSTDINSQLKTVSTQTDWEADTRLKQGPCQVISPRHSPRKSENSCQADGLKCASPVPKCFEGLSEKEIKEYLYREELQKQIEEKNRIKDEIKRKEAQEEARIEAKIQMDLEKMRKQYEEERLQRLELAIKKKEQEDILRTQLATEKIKALEESKAKRKQKRDKSTSPTESLNQRPTSRHSELVKSQSMPSNVSRASNALSDVHEVLRQPLSEIQSSPTDELNERLNDSIVPSTTFSALRQLSAENTRPLSPPIHQHREVDVLAQRAVFNPRVQSSASQNMPLTHSTTVNEKSKRVGASKVVKELSLSVPQSNSHRSVLPPMSPPMLHASLPPAHVSVPPSLHSPSTTIRTNSELLEDKWKVPYTEHHNDASPDVFTKHNRSVLTQLGAFRKHLQEERLRMQQRLLDESP